MPTSHLKMPTSQYLYSRTMLAPILLLMTKCFVRLQSKISEVASFLIRAPLFGVLRSIDDGVLRSADDGVLNLQTKGHFLIELQDRELQLQEQKC
jgi:hypothetical protein